ncbi:MAG: helix-hairpin-helix domain-containing protein [Chloroflexota bacterium]
MNDWLERYRGYILIVLVCLILIGGAFILVQRPTPEPIAIATVSILEPTSTPSPTLVPTPAPLRVYVSGAVRQPDVYVLPPGSIVKDALQAAGGPADAADLNRVNLALALYDQQHIYIPRQDEATPAAPLPGSEPPPVTVSGNETANLSGPINLNTATIEQLDALPGIGPAIAQRIVDYRQANGPFATPEDIMNVKGIGQATFEKLQNQITVR